MGGRGSGSWCRWDTRGYLDDHIAVDVRRWQREGFLWPGNYFAWQWSVNGQRSDDIRIRVGHQHVDLIYRQRIRGGDWRDVEERVRLTYTNCHYGGSRVWFVCPSCGRRVAKLFSQVPYFICRKCCGLPYQSQGETRSDRAMRKARKIRQKLGASMNLLEPIWEKPKGMHTKTYQHLRREAAKAEQISWADLVARDPDLKGIVPDLD